MAIDIKDKIKEIVLELEDKINDNFLNTSQNYCELVIYTAKKKIAEDEDYQIQDAYYFIVDLQTSQTLGTISLAQDDYGLNWVNVSAIKNVFNTAQSSFFDQYLYTVKQFSDLYYIVNFNDTYLEYNKNQNVIPKFKFTNVYEFSIHLLLFTLTAPIYWFSISVAGFGYVPIIATALMFGMFMSFLFGNDDHYY